MRGSAGLTRHHRQKRVSGCSGSIFSFPIRSSPFQATVSASLVLASIFLLRPRSSTCTAVPPSRLTQDPTVLCRISNVLHLTSFLVYKESMAYSCETQVEVLHAAVRLKRFSPPPWVKEVTHLIRKHRKAKRKAQRDARKKNR